MSIIYFNLDKKKFKQIVNDNLTIDVIKRGQNGIAFFLCEYIVSTSIHHYYFDPKQRKFFFNGIVDEDYKIFIDFFSKILIKQTKKIIDTNEKDDKLLLQKFLQIKKIKEKSFIENIFLDILLKKKIDNSNFIYDDKSSKNFFNELMNDFKNLQKNFKTKIKKNYNIVDRPKKYYKKNNAKIYVKEDISKKNYDFLIKDIHFLMSKIPYIDSYEWYDNFIGKLLNNELYNYKKN